jgi:hypothetical protein
VERFYIGWSFEVGSSRSWVLHHSWIRCSGGLLSILQGGFFSLDVFLIQIGLLWSSFDFILQWGCFEETGLVMIDLQQIETLSKYKIGGRFDYF